VSLSILNVSCDFFPVSESLFRVSVPKYAVSDPEFRVSGLGKGQALGCAVYAPSKIDEIEVI